MKVSLHLGAHKTASTFLQMALKKNAERLLAQGVGIVPMMELRAEVTRPLRPRDDDAKVARGLARATKFLEGHLARADVSRMVLSDENLLGDPEQLVRTAALYSNLRGRLVPLARLLEGQEVEIFLAIRHLGHFSRSVYCETLRWIREPFVPLPPYQNAWDGGAQSWVDVIVRLREVFPQAPVTLWTYDMVKGSAPLLLDRISGTQGLAWDMERLFRRHSLSRRATERLIEIGATQGADAMREVAQAIHKQFPPRPKNGRYEMWTKAQNREFAQRHRQDIRAIRALGPGVELLEPPRKPEADG